MKENAVILIAEDDNGHFALVKKNLWRCCVRNEIYHFGDGQEILDFFYKPDQEPKFDSDTFYILLLDIRIPKVDGLQVLKRMKADPELRKIPVIMLTTNSDPNEVDRCYNLGCSFYIVKPSDYNKFMECVEQLGAFLSLQGVKIPLANPELINH